MHHHLHLVGLPVHPFLLLQCFIQQQTEINSVTKPLMLQALCTKRRKIKPISTASKKLADSIQNPSSDFFRKKMPVFRCADFEDGCLYWQPPAYGLVAGHLSVRLNAMFQAEELPASIANLDSALSSGKAVRWFISGLASCQTSPIWENPCDLCISMIWRNFGFYLQVTSWLTQDGFWIAFILCFKSNTIFFEIFVFLHAEKMVPRYLHCHNFHKPK